MKYKTLFKASVLSLAAVALTTACSDDHYDVVIGTESVGKTLWQNIQATPELSDLSEVLQRTHVLRNSTDKSATMTYAELLDQPQTFTFWAPVNGTFSLEEKLNQLEEVKALKAEAAAAATPEETERLRLLAAKKEFDYAARFVQNHIARFNHEGFTEKKLIRMMNEKNSYYTVGELNGVPEGQIIPSSNGALHLLSGVSPFAYNIFDMMAADPNLSKVYAVLSDPEVDKNEFSESASTPGTINENGDMIYVDSVYNNSNSILQAAHASIKNEDSLYIALIPADGALEEAQKSVASLYKYAKTYKYGWSNTKGCFINTLEGLNADSLQTRNANQQLISSMFFSVGLFPKDRVDPTDSASVVDYVLTADSLISTNGVVFYNPTPGKRNPMFNGQEPIKASNGYVFAVNEFKTDPAYSYQEEIEVGVSDGYQVIYTTDVENGSGDEIILTTLNRNEDVKGSVPNDRYRVFNLGGSMEISIRLPRVLSGKYRVLAEVLPNAVNKDYLWIMDEDTIPQKTTFTAQLVDDNESDIGGRTNKLVVPEDEITQVVLYDCVEFKKSYRDMPTGIETFPRLKLAMKDRDQPAKKQRPDGVKVRLSLSRIILQPIRESQEVEE